MSYVNIGANKGYNILEFLLRHDSDQYPSMKHWHHELLRKGIDQHSCGVCLSCRSKVIPSKKLGIVARIVAVELLTNNYNILKEMCAQFIPQTRVLHAAAVKKKKISVYEPYLKHSGHETLGISRSGRPVASITLNEIINGSIWDMVSIDAEGWDGEILKGGRASIENRNIRVIEFEYSGKWKTRLESIISLLWSAGYSCFWTGNNGQLANISPTCHSEIEIHKWSNIVCAFEKEITRVLWNLQSS